MNFRNSFVIRLLLAVLACYRLACLVAEDDGPGFIFTRLREWADGRAKAEQKAGIQRGKWQSLTEGLHCPFCTGVWSAILLAVFVRRPTQLSDTILTILAIAGGQAFLQNRDQ